MPIILFVIFLVILDKSIPYITRLGDSLQDHAGRETDYIVPLANFGGDFFAGLFTIWMFFFLLGLVGVGACIFWIIIQLSVMIYRNKIRPLFRSIRKGTL